MRGGGRSLDSTSVARSVSWLTLGGPVEKTAEHGLPVLDANVFPRLLKGTVQPLGPARPRNELVPRLLVESFQAQRQMDRAIEAGNQPTPQLAQRREFLADAPRLFPA